MWNFMSKWIDYYKILQVHSSAEFEIIESAYKRLCKKYHPDINRSYDSVEKITIINLGIWQYINFLFQ